MLTQVGLLLWLYTVKRQQKVFLCSEVDSSVIRESLNRGENCLQDGSCLTWLVFWLIASVAKWGLKDLKSIATYVRLYGYRRGLILYIPSSMYIRVGYTDLSPLSNFVLCYTAMLWGAFIKEMFCRAENIRTFWTSGDTFLLRGWLTAGPGCPERLWSLQAWRCLESNWPRSWATSSGWPCLIRWGGPNRLQRSQATSTTLWKFYRGYRRQVVCLPMKEVETWKKKYCSYLAF